MQSPIRRHARLFYILPVLVLLFLVGAASYVLNQASAAGAMPAARGAHPVSSINLAQGAEVSGLPPGGRVTLPNGVTVIRELHHDTSPPLRDIPPVPAVHSEESLLNPHPPFHFGNSVVDPVVQRFFGPLAMPTPSLTFEGVSATTSGCSCLPPDTNGAVGPNNYVQTVNTAFEIWDKNGTVVQSARNINTLFSGFTGLCMVTNNGDPVVNYDGLADRWVISQFAFANYPGPGPYDQCFAVSTSGDPTGTYNRYEFTISQTNLDDYPKVGVWPDAYYATFNLFDQTGNYSNPEMVAFDRVRMLAGQTATAQLYNPGNYYSTILPADVDGASGPPAGAPEPYMSVSGNNTLIHLWQEHVDWTNPANTVITGAINLPAAPWNPNLCGGSRNCIPQPGVSSSAYLDSLADHNMFRLAYRRFADHDAMVTNESVNVGGNQSGVRWYELRDPTGSPSIYQQGTYAPDATSRWMGSIDLDGSGNIAVGYSASSTSVYPSIRYAGRLVTDPLGQLSQGEATLIAGGGSQTSTSGRWGDYSDMTVDPTDNCTFWYTDEYYPATSSSTWHTRVGRFRFPSCGQPPPPSPTATTPTPTVAPSNTPTPQPTACASYVQTSSSGASLVPGTQDTGNHCDDCSTALTLPFPVQFYDQSFTSGYISSNGVIEFGSSDYAFGNACLPVPIYNYAIIGYWDDLLTNQSGQGVFSSTTGTAPNRIFNLEWRASLAAQSNLTVNFEIQLYETPPAGAASQVNIIYGTGTGMSGLSATIGIERDMGASTQYSCNTAGITPGLEITYTLPPCATATPGPPTSTPGPATATSTAPVPTVTIRVPSETPTPGGPTNTPISTSTPGGPTNTPTAAAGTATATATPCSIRFSDVHTADYFYTPVLYLACHGVISGYNDGTFRPYNNTTRSQMTKIVVLGFNKAIVTPGGGNYTFTDVTPANPFFSVIETAAAYNIVSGYTCGVAPAGPCDAQHRKWFLPYADVTRGQLSKIDVIAAGWTQYNPPVGHFTDVRPGSTFYMVIETAYCHGVISGYNDGTFRPYNNAIRGQIAKIVYLSITNPPTSCGQ